MSKLWGAGRGGCDGSEVRIGGAGVWVRDLAIVFGRDYVGERWL